MQTVDTIVKDTARDVLLEVYAPWCGHCKQLDPIYKKLAKRFKKVDSVVIAKMDGTENEHPDVEVKGFPTIYFFPAGEEQKPIAFEGGDRSLKVRGCLWRGPAGFHVHRWLCVSLVVGCWCSSCSMYLTPRVWHRLGVSAVLHVGMARLQPLETLISRCSTSY